MVQGNWGSAVYDACGFYTSYNGALAVWAMLARADRPAECPHRCPASAATAFHWHAVPLASAATIFGGSGERTTWRNGYRERTLDTRRGTLQRRTPKLQARKSLPEAPIAELCR